MSEIKVNSIKGVGASAAAITVNNTDGTCTANLSAVNNGQLGGFRNFLINGAMQINQRNQTGLLGYYNPVTGSIYTLDRWKWTVGSSFDTNSARITQDSASPNGFSNSWKIDIYNTQTPSANQNGGVEQKIEAQFLQGLGYGTSDAKTMTLSFHVKSYKTGTYCVQIMQEDGTKYQMHEYTISASNTWEKKTITIVGNTSNAINNDNGVGLRIIWMLTVGSGDHVAATSSWVSGGDLAATSNQVNLWDNGSNDFFLTGCQLEIGTVATEFEHRSVGQELQLCKRYFNSFGANTAGNTSATYMLIQGGYARFGSANSLALQRIFYDVEMRSNPTVKYGRNDNNDDNNLMRWSSAGTNPIVNIGSQEGSNRMGYHITAYNNQAGQTYNDGQSFTHQVSKFRADAEL